MCHIYETAYPNLKSKLNQNELDLLFTPTRKELKLGKTAARLSIHRLGFLIHLKVAQKLLRFIQISTIPPKLIDHIAQSLGLKHYDRNKLLIYDQSSARGNHCLRIRQYLKLSPFESEAKELAVMAAEDAAQVRSRLPDIINVMLEELVKEKYELPAFNTLKRIAQSARSRINNQYFKQVCDLIDDEQKEQLDALFIKKPGDQYTLWHQFKQDPKKPTPKKIKRFLRHHLELRQLYDKLPSLQGLLPYTKYRDYKEEAQVLDASDMASLKPLKRYTLAIVFIRTKYSKMLDDIALMTIKTLQKLDNQGQQKLEEYHQIHKKRTDNLIGKFHDVLMAVSQEVSDSECMETIREVLPQNIDKLIDDCIDHMNYAHDNYLPFLLKPYSNNKRNLLFECLDLLVLKSSTTDKTTETMISLLKLYRNSRKKTINLKDAAKKLGIKKININWMSDKWYKLVTGYSSKKATVDRINQLYFELSVFFLIKDELNNGDLYVEQGEQFNDIMEEYITDEEYEEEITDFLNMMGFASEPAQFVKELKEQLIELSTKIDDEFPANTDVTIKKGKLSIKRIVGTTETQEIKKLKKLIQENLKETSIIDVLIDTEKWLNLHKLFAPLSGFESKIDDHQLRFIMTLACYGLNLGPTQTRRSLQKFSRKQISWLNFHQVTAQQLQKAIEKVVNVYNKYDLTNYWGTGEHVSADGTKWSIYEENLLSEYHIRNRVTGAIAYFHTSDKFIAIFSHFIACGVYEGVHILDYIENESDIYSLQ